MCIDIYILANVCLFMGAWLIKSSLRWYDLRLKEPFCGLCGNC